MRSSILKEIPYRRPYVDEACVRISSFQLYDQMSAGSVGGYSAISCFARHSSGALALLVTVEGIRSGVGE